MQGENKLSNNNTAKTVTKKIHEHYCGLHHGPWKHEYLTPDCVGKDSSGTEWLVSRECPECMGKMRDEYMTTMIYLLPEVRSAKRGSL